MNKFLIEFLITVAIILLSLTNIRQSGQIEVLDVRISVLENLLIEEISGENITLLNNN
jgi:hypothetical protein